MVLCREFDLALRREPSDRRAQTTVGYKPAFAAETPALRSWPTTPVPCLIAETCVSVVTQIIAHWRRRLASFDATQGVLPTMG